MKKDSYSPEIRKLIYTTNAIEGFHRMLRKFTKTKSIFPTDDAVKKAVYMSVLEISKKWTQQIRDWGLIYSQLVIKYEDRLKASQSGLCSKPRSFSLWFSETAGM